MRPADIFMNLPESSLKFVLEEADEAKRQGDNCKAEALINVAYDILDRRSQGHGSGRIEDFSSIG